MGWSAWSVVLTPGPVEPTVPLDEGAAAVRRLKAPRAELPEASRPSPAVHRVAVIIPCFRVKAQIMDVLARIGPECEAVYVVDDCCPEQTGSWVEAQCRDMRVRVLRNSVNTGVGGAVIAGYRQAMADGATILVKLDGDGQMDATNIPQLISPIVQGLADYAKGNRFFDLTHVRRMPAARLFGNAALSFISKLSTGYWDVFDPTNGYTAIHASVAAALPLAKIDQRYFFESDMLFRLGLMRAVVADVPMHAFYGDEHSSLRVGRAVFRFAAKHLMNFVKRVFYAYYLRDFSAASLELALGVVLLAFGVTFGSVSWYEALRSGSGAYPGTIMLAALPIIVGTQMLLAFVSYDVSQVPRSVMHTRLSDHARTCKLIAGRVGDED